jgi:hypothetical protein
LLVSGELSELCSSGEGRRRRAEAKPGGGEGVRADERARVERKGEGEERRGRRREGEESRRTALQLVEVDLVLCDEDGGRR